MRLRSRSSQLGDPQDFLDVRGALLSGGSPFSGFSGLPFGQASSVEQSTFMINSQTGEVFRHRYSNSFVDYQVSPEVANQFRLAATKQVSLENLSNEAETLRQQIRDLDHDIRFLQSQYDDILLAVEPDLVDRAVKVNLKRGKWTIVDDQGEVLKTIADADANPLFGKQEEIEGNQNLRAHYIESVQQIEQQLAHGGQIVMSYRRHAEVLLVRHQPDFREKLDRGDATISFGSDGVPEFQVREVKSETPSGADLNEFERLSISAMLSRNGKSNLSEAAQKALAGLLETQPTLSPASETAPPVLPAASAEDGTPAPAPGTDHAAEF